MYYLKLYFISIFIMLSTVSDAKAPRNLVNISKYFECKDGKYAHKAYIKLLKKVNHLKNVKIWRITEAYPATVRHSSKGHYNGKDIDLTIRNSRNASKVCKFINKQSNFRCLNEYKKRTKYWNGNHLHISYRGK